MHHVIHLILMSLFGKAAAWMLSLPTWVMVLGVCLIYAPIGYFMYSSAQNDDNPEP
jgi:hypothetical protein